jgi:hypothetical protein
MFVAPRENQHKLRETYARRLEMKKVSKKNVLFQ